MSLEEEIEKEAQAERERAVKFFRSIDRVEVMGYTRHDGGAYIKLYLKDGSSVNRWYEVNYLLTHLIRLINGHH